MNDDGVVVAPSRPPDQEEAPERICDGALSEDEESDDDTASPRPPDAEEIPEEAPEAVVAPPPSPD
jgi:hypothetical protein